MKNAIEHALGYESLDAQILCDLSSFHSPTLTSHLFFLLPSLPVVGHTESCAPATRSYAPPVLHGAYQCQHDPELGAKCV